VLASAGLDGTVRLWDPADGTQLRMLEGHSGGVLAVAWGVLDGGPVLASAGLDGTVRLWDPADGTQLRVLTGHTGWVQAVAWGMLNGKTVLASVASDAAVRLWDPRRPQEAVVRFDNPLFGVSVSPDGWLGITGLEGLAVLAIHTQAFTNPQTAQRSSFAVAH